MPFEAPSLRIHILTRKLNQSVSLVRCKENILGDSQDYGQKSRICFQFPPSITDLAIGVQRPHVTRDFDASLDTHWRSTRA